MREKGVRLSLDICTVDTLLVQKQNASKRVKGSFRFRFIVMHLNNYSVNALDRIMPGAELKSGATV